MLPFLAASVISENNSRTGPGPLGLSIFIACVRTIADVAEEEEEDPSSAKSMTDSSRQAGRKKTRIFSKVGAQIRLGQHLSIFFSLSLLLNLLRENNRESLALAMCMQLSGVMSIIGDVHFREMIVGCALFKWFHLQWDHPRCGGSPSCRLDNAQHALC